MSSVHINSVLLVFAGGGTGATFRYLLSHLVRTLPGQFPLSTFIVNVAGALLIGMVYGWLRPDQILLKNLVIVGFLGGFTTFSAFSWETLQLWQNNGVKTAFIYIILSNICCFGGVYCGLKVSEFFH